MSNLARRRFGLSCRRRLLCQWCRLQNTRTTAATTLMIDLMRNPLQIEPFTYCGIGFGAESHETTGLERYQSEKVDLLIAEKPWMRCRSEGPRPLLIRA